MNEKDEVIFINKIIYIFLSFKKEYFKLCNINKKILFTFLSNSLCLIVIKKKTNHITLLDLTKPYTTLRI